MDEGWKSSEIHDKKSPCCLKETVDRNIDVKGHPVESSEKKWEEL